MQEKRIIIKTGFFKAPSQNHFFTNMCAFAKKNDTTYENSMSQHIYDSNTGPSPVFKWSMTAGTGHSVTGPFENWICFKMVASRDQFLRKYLFYFLNILD
jgi:hypothetical protein